MEIKNGIKTADFTEKMDQQEFIKKVLKFGI